MNVYLKIYEFSFQEIYLIIKQFYKVSSIFQNVIHEKKSLVFHKKIFAAMFYFIRFQVWKDLGKNICILIETKKINAFKNWKCTMKFQVLTY